MSLLQTHRFTVAAGAIMLSAGVVLAQTVTSPPASAAYEFDPFNPVAALAVDDATVGQVPTTQPGGSIGGTSGPGRPIVRDPYRPPTRSPFRP